MKVFEALAEAFVGEGVTDVFGLMGDGNMSWYAALVRNPAIRFFDARHEGASLAMADGWARVNGKIGVCSVTCGPGVAQISTSLLVASRARTPIVVFAGQAPESYELQKLDQRRFAEASETGYVELMSPDGAREAVRNAFNMARLESRPVILSAPFDMQEKDCEVFGDYEPSTALMPAPQRMQPDPEAVRQAAQIVAESKKPVVVAGRGALAAGANGAIQRFANRIGALVSTTLLAKGAFSESEYYTGIAGLFASLAVSELYAQADCVIGIGASLNSYTLENGYLFTEARFVQIDSEPQIIMGTGRVAESYVRGDAKAGIEALDAELAARKYTSIGFRTPEVRRVLDTEVIDAKVFEIDPGTLDPREALTLVDDALPPEVGLVSGVGHFFSFVAMHMRRPRTPALTALQFGCIGQGLGTAIGATVAAKKPVVLFEGDSSVMMHVQELDTAARYKLPLLMIVMDNSALGSEYYKLGVHGFDPDLGTVRAPNFAAVAEGMGCRGREVRTLDALRKAVDEFVKSPGPMLIDMHVSRSVISVPYRRLYYAESA